MCDTNPTQLLRAAALLHFYLQPRPRDGDQILFAMSLPPPAQRGSHSPPALIDDAMFEIFLRVPADDPKTLVRAAAVCTTWRRILGDLIFTRQYRAFHGAPPMLGFLLNTHHERSWWKGGNMRSEEYLVSSFVSTASFRSPACHERRHWRVLDSRHGLVLFHTPKRDENFVVCDLVTYDRWRISVSTELFNIIYGDDGDEDEDEGITWNAAVLCAKDRCDHTYCHYGPFLVALVGCDEYRGMIFASVYSSETRKWSDMISVEEEPDIDMAGNIAVVGDKVYFQCNDKDMEITVEYNIGENELSLFDLPEDEDVGLPKVDLMGVEDGMLLFASVMGHRLYLCSMEAGQSEEWVRRRVIELEPVLPPHALFGVSVVGFAEGVGVIFLNTEAGLYTIELSSGRSKKVHGDKSVKKVMPYMSFYTKAWGRSPTSD